MKKKKRKAELKGIYPKVERTKMTANNSDKDFSKTQAFASIKSVVISLYVQSAYRLREREECYIN